MRGDYNDPNVQKPLKAKGTRQKTKTTRDAMVRSGTPGEIWQGRVLLRTSRTNTPAGGGGVKVRFPHQKRGDTEKMDECKKEALPGKCIVPDLALDSNTKLSLLRETTKRGRPKPDV